jgi:hypothetical protein
MKGVTKGISPQAAKPTPLPFLRLIGIEKKKKKTVTTKKGTREINASEVDGSFIVPPLKDPAPAAPDLPGFP